MSRGFWQFPEALDGEEAELELLRNLLKRCARRGFRSEAFRALIRRGVRFAMELAWSYYQDSVTAQRAPAVAYWRAVFFFWDLVNWPSVPCRVLAELATYVAEAAAEYKWPAKWPFLVMAAVAAEKNGCRTPDAVAEALGPEYEALKAFLEQGVGVVEVAGRKAAVVKKKSSIAVEDLHSADFEKTIEKTKFSRCCFSGVRRGLRLSGSPISRFNV